MNHSRYLEIRQIWFVSISENHYFISYFPADFRLQNGKIRLPQKNALSEQGGSEMHPGPQNRSLGPKCKVWQAWDVPVDATSTSGKPEMSKSQMLENHYFISYFPADFRLQNGKIRLPQKNALSEQGGSEMHPGPQNRSLGPKCKVWQAWDVPVDATSTSGKPEMSKSQMLENHYFISYFPADFRLQNRG